LRIAVVKALFHCRPYPGGVGVVAVNEIARYPVAVRGFLPVGGVSRDLRLVRAKLPPDDREAGVLLG
jgi:hypothetical protein